MPSFEVSVSLRRAWDQLQKAGLVRRSTLREGATQASQANHPSPLTTDSRQVGTGSVFLAYKGVSRDSHDYLETAAHNGAAWCVVEDLSRVPKDLPAIEVTSGRAAWSWLSACAYDNPQDSMTFLGVTGTNGKTSTVWILRELLRSATPDTDMPDMTDMTGITDIGDRYLAIGTLGAYIADEYVPTTHTTPDPPEFFGILRRAYEKGVRTCLMEVSSHAVAQEKLAPVRFSGAAFTSFSRDHLDFHKTPQAYWQAKWRFIEKMTREDATFAFSHSLRAPSPLEMTMPPHGVRWVYGGDSKAKHRSKLQESGATDHILSVESLGQTIRQHRIHVQTSTNPRGTSPQKLALDLKQELEIPYLGQHGLENFAAALILSQRILGRFPKPSLDQLRPIPGRLELVRGVDAHDPSATNFTEPVVVVDYAHTPDGLEKALQALRPMTKGRLITVFGCGGDRDPGKRPEMGRIAESLSDEAIVTSDNPRNEDPEEILRQIQQGMQNPAPKSCIIDRQEAIALAISQAATDDTVLIAGKGHETYQIVGSETRHFDDREVARNILRTQRAHA